MCDSVLISYRADRIILGLAVAFLTENDKHQVKRFN
jgi:hypothetical protein